MAITKLVNTITDTNTKYSVQHTGLAGDATDLSDSIFANLSALKYASATVTISAAPTANLCIGEVLTTNDSTPIYLRVTDYTAGATTFKAYKVTSATDITPLGLDCRNCDRCWSWKNFNRGCFWTLFFTHSC